MNSENVFNKAAKKLNLKYVGRRYDGGMIFGYFEDGKGGSFKTFYFPSIKDVVRSLINDGAEAV